jgi:hypothetical protein
MSLNSRHVVIMAMYDLRGMGVASCEPDGEYSAFERKLRGRRSVSTCFETERPSSLKSAMMSMERV